MTHDCLFSYRSRFAVVMLVLASALCPAQRTAVAPAQDTESVAATTERMVHLRDSIIEASRAAGMTCTAAPPNISVAPIRSWGNFDDGTNTLTTPDWTQLGPDDRAFFSMLAGPDADEAAAKASFENVAHRWIFSHEMGHWVQYCQKVTNKTPWQMELGANRFAYAYWRTAGVQTLGNFFHAADGALQHMPNPVPSGQDMQKFFNDNYSEKLAATSAYSWFQAEMIHQVYAERPPPTLAEAVKKPAY